MGQTVEVLVGTLGRAHGLRGEISVNLRTDEPERRFAAGVAVLIGGRPREVAALRWQAGTLLVRFDGVTDRTGAEALRGEEVWARVPADEAPQADGEFYDRQLLGVQVRDAAGEVVGSVARVLHMPAQDVLVVRSASGERLVPFVSELVPVVDLAAGFVQVADVRGLLDDLEG